MISSNKTQKTVSFNGESQKVTFEDSLKINKESLKYYRQIPLMTMYKNYFKLFKCICFFILTNLKCY